MHPLLSVKGESKRRAIFWVFKFKFIQLAPIIADAFQGF
jgi:hypothetical protein